MTTAAWICLLLPLASALAITLAGTSISRRTAALHLDPDDDGVVRGRGRRVRRDVGPQPGLTRRRYDVVDVALRRAVPLRALAPRRPALDRDDADRRRRRLADRRLLGRLHGRRGRGASLLRLHVAVRLLDAAARRERQPAAAARRLGHGRALELPADRLPPGPAVGDRGREEGVRDERVRRRDDGARALPADPAHRPPRLRERLRLVAHRRRGGEPDRARPARRRAREVGAAAAAHLAPGRDGGPDAGQRPHPRGDDGHRRRLPDRALPSALREGVGDPGPRRRARRGDAR